MDRQPRRRLDPDERRASILDAAAAVFAEHPYPEVTVSAIATRAGASDALLYRYFPGKDAIYAETVRSAIDTLLERQTAALQALDRGVPPRDRVREATLVYLDHIAEHPAAWATPLLTPNTEPLAAAEIRTRTRQEYVRRLDALLEPSDRARHDYALWGYFGFLDAACLRWVERGCPDDERWSLVDAALGALEGGLGDWAA